MSTVIYLIRHAKVDKAKVVQNTGELEGNTEADIDESFIPKIEELSERLKLYEVESFYSSKYIRAKRTAEILSRGKEIKLDDRLGERKGGIPNLDITPQEYYRMQLENPDFKFPEGESVNEIMYRMYQAVKDIIHENRGKKAVVVSHGASITFLLTKWCNVQIIDVPKKIRRFEFNGNVIHQGVVNNIMCFKLTFDDNDLIEKIEVV